jgi:hypothetical protein
LSFERLFAVQRASASIASRRLYSGSRTEPARMLRRQIATLEAAGHKLAEVIDRALKEDKRSVDRAIIHAYLGAMPSSHADFRLLRQAAETAADRHSWSWRDAGRQFALWSPDRDRFGTWRLAGATLEAVACHAPHLARHFKLYPYDSGNCGEVL